MLVILYGVVGVKSAQVCVCMRRTSDGGGSGGQGEDAEDVGEHFEGGLELRGSEMRCVCFVRCERTSELY